MRILASPLFACALSLGMYSCGALPRSASRSLNQSQFRAMEVQNYPQRVLGGDTETAMARPPLIIYRTREDYSDYVPVSLSGARIASYPAPSDLSEHSKPVALGGGYLLDRRGIGPNTAFTDYTYSEYIQLENVNTQILLEHLLDREPFLELYVCGPMPLENAVESARQLVRAGFPDCHQLVPITAPRVREAL